VSSGACMVPCCTFSSGVLHIVACVVCGIADRCTCLLHVLVACGLFSVACHTCCMACAACRLSHVASRHAARFALRVVDCMLHVAVLRVVCRMLCVHAPSCVRACW
jgi:hypothetical protein